MLPTKSLADDKLTEDNYQRWRDSAMNKLRRKHLWDGVIEGVRGAEYRDLEWNGRNEEALKYLKESSESKDILQTIDNCDTALCAWNTLKHSRSPCAMADIEQGTDLLRAVLNNDSERAGSLMNQEANSKGEKTVLHVAVEVRNETMMKNLLAEQPDLLEKCDAEGYTALARLADLTDNTAMAKLMVDKNNAVLGFRNSIGFIPVVVAAIKGHRDMTSYLFEETPPSLLNDTAINGFLLTGCITGQIFDVALELLEREPQLPLNQKLNDISPLYALAQMPPVFPSGSRLPFWQRWLYHCLTHDHKGNPIEIRKGLCRGDPRTCETGPTRSLWGKLLTQTNIKILWGKILGFYGIKGVYEKKMTHFQVVEILCRMAEQIKNYDDGELQEASVCDSLLEASRNGIPEFIRLMVEANPRLYYVKDSRGRGIFSHAVLKRQEKIFNLVDELDAGPVQAVIAETDNFNDNLLHLLGKSEGSSELDRSTNPALKMQKELQWFEAVKGILHPKFHQAPNVEGKTPEELFREKHIAMVGSGMSWAKNTSNHFAVVATLLVTIMFTAAFTVPGGVDDDGVPVLLNQRMFTIFMVADALSLFASTTSVMVFIRIVTSRFVETKLHKSLPKMLMFGLLSLLCAVLTMMLAFCAALSLMLRGHLWMVYFAMLVASVAVLIFLRFQLPLLIRIYNSTYRSPINVKPRHFGCSPSHYKLQK